MKRIVGNTFVVEGSTNIGVYMDEKIYLVDTGTNKKAVRDLIESFLEKEFVVLNTHHHADHISLNHYVQKKTSCEIFAPSGEVSFIENPILETYILFGSSPPSSLRRSFFLARGSEVSPVEDLDMPLKVVELPGHTPFHVGYLTPDGVFFSGDLYFSKDIVEKYFYPYHTDLGSLRESIERLRDLDFDFIIPSHGKVTKDPEEDVNFMMDRIDFIKSEIFKIADGKSHDEITLEFSKIHDVDISGGFYHLFRSFVGAVLVDLESEGLLSEKNGIWRRV